MSTIPAKAPVPPPPPLDDPFRYGWRYVRRPLPGGGETIDQVPLTLDDVLHPEEGDFIVHDEAHDEDRYYLKAGIRAHLLPDPTALVLSDHRVAWDVPGQRALGPDIAVFFGVPEWNRSVGTFDVAQMKIRPRLIIEIVSPDYRDNDVVKKVEEYHRAQVPFYAIVDVRHVGSERILRLIGYRWTPERYEELPLDPQGRLWLEPVGLWLEIEGDRVALRTPDGRKIGSYEEVDEARREAEQYAAAEKERAAAERRRAEVEEQRAAAEKQRAEMEQQRAESEKQRAESEKQRADANEDRIRQLEAELSRLRGPSQ